MDSVANPTDSPNLAPSDYPLFGHFNEKACEGCRVPCPSGDRVRRATLTRQEYVLLYHGGRRLSTKKGTNCRNKYVSAML
jgi:hypothetical protein